ncbi:MAG: hypothetical protein ACI9MR_000224 [Myxococcota bacterium]|jgi:hypothetical protein
MRETMMRRWTLMLGTFALVSTGLGCDDGNPGIFMGDTVSLDTDDTVAGDTTETADTAETSETADTTVADTADTTVADTADTTVADTTPQPPPIVSATCVDGQYTETLPTGTEDISGIISSFDPNDKIGFADRILSARYPIGAFLTREAYKIPQGKAFLDQIMGQATTASRLLGTLSTVVHEGGHVYDINQGGFSDNVLVFRTDLRLSCQGGDTAERFGNTFARSRINGDTHSSKLPGDFYQDVYLDGDPNDATFDGGDQGFNSVLEEATQYVNSLATDFAIDDTAGNSSTSARDGILTFLWYIERYLQFARTNFPDAHAFILGDSCHREAILTIWGRAWLYLDATDSIASLGIDDDAIEALVLEEGLLTEIQAVREAHGCR